MSESISTVEQLVAARDARGLAPEDVLRQLKLAPRQLRAIETGDWEALPGAAFTRAVLRSYGRILQADVEPLLASISPSVPPATLRPASSLDTPLPSRSMLGFGSGGGGSRLAWVALVLLAVVALALFFGGGGDFSNVRSWLSELRGTPASETPAPGAAGDAAGPQGAVGDSSTLSPAPSTTRTSPSQGAAAPDSAGTAGSSSVGEARRDTSPPGGSRTASDEAKTASAPAAAGAPTVAPSPGAASAPATGGTAASPKALTTEAPKPADPAAERAARQPADDAARAGRPTLRLRFERESWIEVKAADGTVLAIGTQPAQSTREISGAGPLSVVIGNAQYVRAEVDGKAFDLAPHTRAAIARVTIP